MGLIHEIFLAPAVNFVMFVAQRPSAIIADRESEVHKNFIKFP